MAWARRWCAPVLLAVPLCSCGGNAERTLAGETDSQGGSSSAEGGASVSGGSVSQALGGRNDGGSGGISGGPAGSGGMGASVGGGPANMTFGDFDQPSPGLPQVPDGSPSFFWGSPSEVHIGNWFVTSSDGFSADARVGIIEPPRGDSTLACHASGAQFARGVDLYVQLDHPGNRPVDLSHYTGLSFWARLTASNPNLLVVLNDGSGSLPEEGSFVGLPAATFAASEEWQQFEMAFSDPARASAVVSIDFVVSDGGEALDLWIDEVTLLGP